MYKDKAKQKQAQREASRRYRAKKGMAQGVTLEGMTAEGMTQVKGVATASDPAVQETWNLHAKQRRPDVYPHKSRACNLALPGEPDYEGVCVKSETGVWDIAKAAVTLQPLPAFAYPFHIDKAIRGGLNKNGNPQSV